MNVTKKSLVYRVFQTIAASVFSCVLTACGGGGPVGASGGGNASNPGGNASNPGGNASNPSTVPADGAAVGYFTQAGKIFNPSGQEIQIRGVSHFGFNGVSLQPQFLWSMGWKEQIAQIKSLGFNAIRLPFVPDTLYNTTPVDLLPGVFVNPTLNPDLIGKTPLQALDLWMAEADRQGIYVMLDFHSVSMVRQYPTWFLSDPADFNLMYNKQAYTKENWTRDLAFVAQRYAPLSHFFAIDLFNEPNGVVRWDAGDANMANPKNYWKPAVEEAAAAVLKANPNLLIFVQGTEANWDGKENSSLAMNWGINFQPEAYNPLNIPADKLVLSPHVYGVRPYEPLFGQFHPVHAVVPGEWGGKYIVGGVGVDDAKWMDDFVSYMISKGMRNSFYWAYTPNSFDVGGILDDSLNVRQDKMALLRKLWGTGP